MTARIAILAILAIWLAAFVNNANGQSVITRWPANNAVARPMVDLMKAFQPRAGADAGHIRTTYSDIFGTVTLFRRRARGRVGCGGPRGVGTATQIPGARNVTVPDLKKW